MRKVGLVLMMSLALTQSPVWAASNPARQYEMQRGTESPADGIWHVYDRNGNLVREEHYKNYRLDGEIKSFYPSGALKEKMYYEDGYKEGPVTTYFENGAIQMEATYKRNNFDGSSRRYYPSGEVESEVTYETGKLIGEKRIYHKSGALKQVLVYKDGVLHGIALTYSEDGQVIREEDYRNGLLGSRKEYQADSLTSVLVKSPAAVKPNEGQPKLPPSQSMQQTSKESLSKP